MFEKRIDLICPKCDSVMERVNYQNIEIDRCTNCKGLWMDAFEKAELKAKKDSEVVDTGDKEVGKKYNNKKNVNCPKCNIPMISKPDIEQKHIRYEKCNSCHGVFFDAGEFTDFKEQNLLDFIKSKFSKK